MTIQCDNCGTQNKETAKFCGGCGGPLSRPVQGVVAGGGPVPAPRIAPPQPPPATAPPPSAAPPTMPQGLGLILHAAASAFDWPKMAFGAVMIAVTLLVFGLTVFISGQLNTPQGQNVMMIFGLGVTFVVTMLFSSAVVKFCYESITRGTLMTKAEALSFAFSNFGAIVFAPLVLFLAGSIISFIEAVLFSAIRIRDFGEVVVAILLTPVIVLNIALSLILTYGTWLMHVTITEHQSTTGETLKLTYQLLRQGAKRIIPSLLGLSLGAILVCLIVGYALLSGYGMTFFLASRAAGPEDLWRLSLLTGLPQLAMGGLGSLGGFIGSASGAYSLPMQLANIIFWLGSLVLISVAAAYPLVFFYCGVIHSYLQERGAMAAGAGAPLRVVQLPRAGMAAPAKTRCPHCGSMQDADARFCQVCGRTLGG